VNRRELIQWMSAGTISVSTASKKTGIPELDRLLPERKDESVEVAADVKELSNEQAILVFSLKHPMSSECLDTLKDNIRAWHRDHDIRVPAILLPYGLGLSVLRIPASLSLSGVQCQSKE